MSAMKLEIHFSSFEELAAFTARHTGEVSAPVKETTDRAPKAPSAQKTPKPAKVAPEPEPDLSVEDDEDVLEDGLEEAEEQITYDKVKEAILRVNQHKGKEAAIAILAKFGAKKVGPDLKEKDYPAIFVECKRVLG